jgi:hypothetical protein
MILAIVLSYMSFIIWEHIPSILIFFRAHTCTGIWFYHWSHTSSPESRIYFFWCYGLNSGPIPWATPPHQPCFKVECFQNKLSQTICQGWLQTMFLMISASSVNGTTSMGHWHPAWIGDLNLKSKNLRKNTWRYKNR